MFYSLHICVIFINTDTDRITLYFKKSFPNLFSIIFMAVIVFFMDVPYFNNSPVFGPLMLFPAFYHSQQPVLNVLAPKSLCISLIILLVKIPRSRISRSKYMCAFKVFVLCYQIALCKGES